MSLTADTAARILHMPEADIGPIHFSHERDAYVVNTTHGTRLVDGFTALREQPRVDPIAEAFAIVAQSLHEHRKRCERAGHSPP